MLGRVLCAPGSPLLRSGGSTPATPMRPFLRSSASSEPIVGAGWECRLSAASRLYPRIPRSYSTLPTSYHGSFGATRDHILFLPKPFTGNLVTVQPIATFVATPHARSSLLTIETIVLWSNVNS